MLKNVHKGGSVLCTDQHCARYIPPGGRGKGETDTARITSASHWCALFAESRGKAVYGSTGRRHNRVHEKDGCVDRSSLLKRRARSGFTPETEKEDYRS